MRARRPSTPASGTVPSSKEITEPMATKILINAVRIGGIGQLWPGSSYDDVRDAGLVTQVNDAGGLLIDSGNATIAAAAPKALAVRARAGSLAEAESVMQSAVQASQNASIGGADTVSSTTAAVNSATTGITNQSAVTGISTGASGAATLTRGVHETFVYPPLAGDTLATVREDTAAGIITAQAGHARTFDVVFAAGWEGGNVTLDGLAPDGTAQTELYTSPGGGGGTVAGTKAFASLTAVTNSVLAGAADLATVKTGGRLAVGGPVTAFLFIAVDGVRDAIAASTPANGTFATTTALDGTQFIECGYSQAHAISTHTHSITDAGHTHTVTDLGHTHTGVAHTHTLS